MVADSLYSNVIFLAVFLTVQNLYALVRMRSNRNLYEEPPAREPGQKGRPRQHGRPFKLTAPWREPDHVEASILLGQRVRLLAWEGLHFYQLPCLVSMACLVGRVLCVQFLKPDGTPRFQRPLLSVLERSHLGGSAGSGSYCTLWRFAIEHMFRFLKQHLGLTCANSPDLEHRQRWVWCCALAYCQLLLMRHDVADQQKPCLASSLRPGQKQASLAQTGAKTGTQLIAQLGFTSSTNPTRRKRRWQTPWLLSPTAQTLSGRLQAPQTAPTCLISAAMLLFSVVKRRGACVSPSLLYSVREPCTLNSPQ